MTRVTTFDILHLLCLRRCPPPEGDFGGCELESRRCRLSFGCDAASSSLKLDFAAGTGSVESAPGMMLKSVGFAAVGHKLAGWGTFNGVWAVDAGRELVLWTVLESV